MPVERPKIRQPIPPHAKKVFSGEIFDVYQWEQELYDGTTAVFEKLKRPDTVLVVPTLPDKRLLLLDEEQPGNDRILSFPGGRIDEGETPDAAALRELHEETGHTTDELIFWKALQPVTKIDWVIYFFVARGCRMEGKAHADAGEKISVRTITFDEMLELPDDPMYRNQDLALDLIAAKHDPAKRAVLEKIIYGG